MARSDRVKLSGGISEDSMYRMLDAMGMHHEIIPDGFMVGPHAYESNGDKTHFHLIGTSRGYFAVEHGTASDDELLATFSRLPPRFDKLRNILMDAMQLPPIEDRHRDMAKQEDRIRGEKLQTLANAIRDLPKLASDDAMPVTSQNSRFVSQRGKGILTLCDKEEFIYTPGIGPCIAVIMHNPRTQSVGLSHVARTADLPLLDEMQEQLAQAGQTLEVSMWGGRKGTSELLGAHILEHVKAQPALTLKAIDICDPARETRTTIAVSPSGATRALERLPEQQKARFRIEPSGIQPASAHLKRKPLSRGKSMSDSSNSGVS